MLIGLTGRARTGKDTVAAHLVNAYGFRRTTIAEPIRRMLKAGLGLSDVEFEPPLKEREIACFGKSPRQLMQTLGTEWGRELVNPDLWIDLAFRHIQQNGGMFGVHWVITDVRFDSEADEIRAQGGRIWCIRRPGAEAVAHHLSEAGIDLTPRDARLDNTGSIAQLQRQVDALFEFERSQVAPRKRTA